MLKRYTLLCETKRFRAHAKIPTAKVSGFIHNPYTMAGKYNARN